VGGGPFTVADIFYGITYTAKAWAGLISGWLSGYLVMKFGSYQLALVIVVICSLIAAAISNPRFLKMPQK
jgi:hypothetical protein